MKILKVTILGLMLGSLGGTGCTVTTGDSGDEPEASEPDADEDGGAGDKDEDTDTSEDTDSGVDEDTDTSSATDAGDDSATAGDDAGAGDKPEASEPDAEESDGGGQGEQAEGDAAAEAEPEPGPVEIDWFDCDDVDTDGATTSPNRIDEDTTWSGVVLIESDVLVTDVEFTIEAGTTVVMETGTSIEFAWAGSSTTLMAEGTADEPIRFCGSDPEPGFWGGVVVSQDATSNSVMRHVLIDGGGENGPALTLDADINVENVQVTNSADVGVQAEAFEPDSTGLSVKGAQGAAVVLTSDVAVDEFPLGGAFVDNEDNRAEIAFGRVDSNTVFHDLGIPYYLDGDLLVEEVEVEFAAGAEFLMGPDVGIEFGWAGQANSVRMSGTESRPVVFRGASAKPGYWHGLLFSEPVLSDSLLSFVEIHDAGGENSYALDFQASLELHNVSLKDNELGARISAEGLDKDSDNLTITGSTEMPLVVAPDALTSIPRGGDFSGNEKEYIELEGGRFSVAGNVADLGVPYRVTGNILTEDGSSMTIEPGSEFMMSGDTGIEVAWAGGAAELIAEGTEEEPIRFYGFDAEPGYWTGLLISSPALNSTSLQWVEISHGGGGSPNGGDLTLARPVSVMNCTFSDSSGYGIVVQDADDTSDYTADNTFVDNESGDVKMP